MERTSSSSIFTLAQFFSHNTITHLSSWDPSAAINIPSPVTNDNNNTDENSKEIKDRPKLYCNSCFVGFEDVKEQHAHYKTEWHSFNLKLRLAGANSIGKEEFEALGDISESSSGSDESDPENGSGDSYDESSTKDKTKLASFLKKESEATSPKEEEKTISKSAKLAFAVPDRQQVFTVWRCLCDEELKKGDVAGALDALKKAAINKKWTILLCSGGRFAGAVFDGNNCLCHKAMHRYTVRKKQGGSQSSRDASGNAPKSAGASLRRYNETRLREDIEAILQSWKDHIASSHYIFYFAPKGAPRSMLIFENSPVQAKDSRLRKIPFPIQRPTFVETKHVQQALSTVDFFKPTTQEITNNTTTEEKELSKKVDDLNLDSTTNNDEAPATTQKPKKKKTKKPASQTETGPKVEDPIYVPIRKGDLDEVKRLLEQDETYQFVENPDDVMTPLFAACVTKNLAMVSYLLSNEITNEDINVTIPSHNFSTALHYAASQGQPQLVSLLLEADADPTVQDINSRVPYDAAKDKETRNVFRKFAGKNLHKWNYQQAHIEPITDADEKEKHKKEAEKRKKKKQAQKQKKEEEKKEKAEAEQLAKKKAVAEEEKKIEKDAKKERDTKVQALSDREKRALAAEKRLMATKGIIAQCEHCKNEIVGVPFERLEFKYCTTKCVVEHKKAIGR